MISHAPHCYLCPFCQLVSGIQHENLLTASQDIVFRNEAIMAFVASHWWPRNKGHVLVIPTGHFENLYTLPDELGAQVHAASRQIAIAMKKAYGCDGISTRQHNEPSGNQEVWHYHLHIFPRYANDELYLSQREKYRTTAEERLPYGMKLRKVLSEMGADVPKQ